VVKQAACSIDILISGQETGWPGGLGERVYFHHGLKATVFYRCSLKSYHSWQSLGVQPSRLNVSLGYVRKRLGCATHLWKIGGGKYHRLPGMDAAISMLCKVRLNSRVQPVRLQKTVWMVNVGIREAACLI
jgi:hypothetical protein